MIGDASAFGTLERLETKNGVAACERQDTDDEKLPRSHGSPLLAKEQAGFRSQSTFRIARNAFCGISTLPTCFMRFFPSFCFSRSLRFRLMSPP
jgi:hypothetical protein